MRKTYPNIEASRPDICISRKISICNRIVANTFRKHLRPFKITDSQLSILFVLSKGESVNQKKLGDLLQLEKSTVNRNLDRLFAKKYINYNKFTHIILTARGKAFLNKVIPSWELAMEELQNVLKQNGVSALNLVVKKLNTPN